MRAAWEGGQGPERAMATASVSPNSRWQRCCNSVRTRVWLCACANVCVHVWVCVSRAGDRGWEGGHGLCGDASEAWPNGGPGGWQWGE